MTLSFQIFVFIHLFFSEIFTFKNEFLNGGYVPEGFDNVVEKLSSVFGLCCHSPRDCARESRRNRVIV